MLGFSLSAPEAIHCFVGLPFGCFMPKWQDFFSCNRLSDTQQLHRKQSCIEKANKRLTKGKEKREKKRKVKNRKGRKIKGRKRNNKARKGKERIGKERESLLALIKEKPTSLWEALQ